MAIFGWDTLKMAEKYPRGADQKRLAQSAMYMLDMQEQNSTESCPTEQAGGTFLEKISTESRLNFAGGARRGTSFGAEVFEYKKECLRLGPERPTLKPTDHTD
jgi:hypothetical protein